MVTKILFAFYGVKKARGQQQLGTPDAEIPY
jgi:hypothetical protein